LNAETSTLKKGQPSTGENVYTLCAVSTPQSKIEDVANSQWSRAGFPASSGGVTQTLTGDPSGANFFPSTVALLDLKLHHLLDRAMSLRSLPSRRAKRSALIGSSNSVAASIRGGAEFVPSSCSLELPSMVERCCTRLALQLESSSFSSMFYNATMEKELKPHLCTP
jgi:hypothetical protein